MVARALCGSSAASWSWCTRLLQLWHRQISSEARLLAPPRGFGFPPANFVRTHRNARDRASYSADSSQNCVHPYVKWCPPHVPRCTRLPLRLPYRSCGSKVIREIIGRKEGGAWERGYHTCTIKTFCFQDFLRIMPKIEFVIVDRLRIYKAITVAVTLKVQTYVYCLLKHV